MFLVEEVAACGGFYCQILAKVFGPRRSPRHARRVQFRGAGEGETEAKVAPAVLQFKEKSTGVREPLPERLEKPGRVFGE